MKSDRQVDIRLPADLRLAPASRYYWQVKIWDGDGVASPWSSPAWFETALLAAADWSGAKWIGHRGPSNPLLRGVVDIDKQVRKARIYASARGVYLLSINGQRVGDHYLAPGWTDYSKRIQTQTYDVTTLLRSGSNVIGAALGDGWFRGKVGLGWRQVYGDTLAFIAKLHVTYEDGSTASFVTDDSWRSAPGPFVQADLQDGEIYDARLEQPGWDRVAPNSSKSDAAAWAAATVVASDLAPELFDVGRRLATEVGAELEWREADAEHLPFRDAEFDVALSTVGIMFAPHHEQAAGELVRVVKPGGMVLLSAPST